jgi:hypothetical protein
MASLGRGAALLGGAALLAAFVLRPAPGAWAQQLELGVERIEHPLFGARDLNLRIERLEGGAALLDIGELRLAERRIRGLRVRCPDYRRAGPHIQCLRGELASAEPRQALPLRFAFDAESQSLEVGVEPGPGERWRLRSAPRGAEHSAELVLEDARVERLAPWLPQVAAAGLKGRVDGTLSWRGKGGSAAVEGRLRVAEAAFSDPSGTRAADRLAATVALAASLRDGVWTWRAELEWHGGEIYWAPWYAADGGLRLVAGGALDAERLRIDAAKVSLRDAGEIALRADLVRDGWRIERAGFESGMLKLKPLAALLLAPLLEQAGAPKLEVDGSLRASGALGAEGLTALDLDLDGVSIAEGGRRFGLSALSGPLRWRSDGATEGRLAVGGAFLDKLPLDGFELPWRAQGMRFAVPRLDIPVLDGRLRIENLRAAREDGAWRWEFGGALEPVSMERLSVALGLPAMRGSLSASIPRVSHAASTISLDGALIVQVFDGYLSATDLRLIEPLGRVPRLTGTLDMRHLDLGQLTETFSFGNITGYLDGYVKDMELADWRPQRFDALVISSPGDYRRRISQRAVQNIGALGGAGAAAAIQRSLLRMFDEFGYSKLGMSCILRQGVCEMGGVEEAPRGYVIVKGGGVPSISVIGYNRRVDWDELLARLKRVTASNAAPVIR